MSTLDTDVLLTRSPEAEADSQFIRRWSPRAMSGEAVTLGEIEQLVEAARWAPSCFNSQPWRFIYALRDTPQWQPMFDLIMDMNQAWAKDAGALVAIVARTTFEHNDAPAPTYGFDTGSAWMSFALQAQSMGLVTHAMWGVEHDQAPAVLNLGEVYKLQAMVAVGHSGDKQDLPQPLQDREVPSPRKAFSELAFAGQLPSEAQS
ncbi:MAG: nitroreductase family protein [Gammaproteobacteria bacterium]|jgi:nitroreductase|nr:nitroreductase family protein [Gammaproteobacteria bacterium]MDG1125172.1 nitroreductase family protein [Pseudomonadales bacterium]